jgi:voltage-gated potassium channel
MVRRGSGQGRDRVGSKPVRLRISHTPRLRRYLLSIVEETYFLRLVGLLLVLWLLFAAGMSLVERRADGGKIHSYGQALYWGVAAFSTAGIADTPVTGLGQLIGGTWIVTGSVLFFGIIVGSITGYFMRPVQRPARQIVDTIEYNLEHLDDLSIDELDLLKKTTARSDRAHGASERAQGVGRVTSGCQLRACR